MLGMNPDSQAGHNAWQELPERRLLANGSLIDGSLGNLTNVEKHLHVMIAQLT